jgi:hypothetical protein
MGCSPTLERAGAAVAGGGEPDDGVLECELGYDAGDYG